MTSPSETATPDEPIALAAGASHTRADWEKAAAAVLRKAGRLADDDPDSLVWDKLTRTTLDGIAITPLGTPDVLAEVRTHGRPDRAGEWDVRACFADPDAKRTAADVKTDLENGVTSVWLRVGPGGVAAEDVPVALGEVLLDVAPVVLESPDAQAAAEALLGLADSAGVKLHPDSNLGADPVGASVRGQSGGADDLLATVELARSAGVRGVVVDATAVHDLGASDVQELGYSLAVAAAYLRTLTDAGIPVAEAARLMEFRYAVTDEQFPSIAKLRAARRLWDRMLELSGVEDAGERRMRLHAVSSRPMMSKYDPWVNMLRTCVAAFAAGAGGADAVTVLPFDEPLGLPDAFSRRIARNTSALLISESHVARVSDPAGGAYAVERLTDDLAVAAWAELGRIEEAGGIEAALADGSLRARIDEVVAERDRQVARRKRPITGLSEFPNLHEALPERRPHPEDAPRVRPYGHAFEALRDEPVGQKVFLATMGTVAAHTARATFASNLLAAGGIDVVNLGRHDDVDAVLASYRGPDGGQPVVCLVGADQAYAAWGADLVAALREAGARHVILAGKPGEKTVAADLVDDSCAMGLDALDFLTRTREALA